MKKDQFRNLQGRNSRLSSSTERELSSKGLPAFPLPPLPHTLRFESPRGWATPCSLPRTWEFAGPWAGNESGGLHFKTPAREGVTLALQSQGSHQP